MMEYSTQRTRRLRRAFAQGWLSGLNPNSREATVSLARQALARLSETDKHALVVESALAEGSDEAIVRSGSMMLAVLVFLKSKLQSPLRRALLIQAVYEQMRRLIGTDVTDDGVGNETIH